MAEPRLLSFNFTGAQAVRVVMVYGTPWFVASDVSTLLEYLSAKDMTRMLDDDEKGRQIVPTPGGDQSMTVISESGLYSAVLRSRKPEAKQFRKWVTSEVLPSIRKTGRYEEPAQPAPRTPVKRLLRVEFLSLPFIDVNSPFKYWCLPLEGDYFSGYDVGRAMAVKYLTFLRDYSGHEPDGSFLPFILETFMKRFQCLNGMAFVDEPQDRSPIDFHILQGHYAGFFGTVGQAAWLGVRATAIH